MTSKFDPKIKAKTKKLEYLKLLSGLKSVYNYRYLRISTTDNWIFELTFFFFTSDIQLISSKT